MTKYDLGSTTGFMNVEVVKSVDLSQFSDLNLVNIISLITEYKRDSPWGIKTGGSISSKPFANRNILYFGANDHKFYAVNAKTGEELWRFDMNGPASVFGSASIWKDRIIFSCYDGNIYCLSLDGKRVLWKFDAKDKIATTPVIHKDVIYFGSKDCNLYAVSAETGKKLWRLSTDHDICCPPLIHQGSIYFGSRDGVYKVSLDGRLIWKFPIRGDVDAEIAAHGETIYFGCSDRNVYAVSTDGDLVWRVPTGGPIICDATVLKGRVYIGSFDGNVYCIDIRGNIIWRVPTGDVVTAAPKIVKNRVYFASFDKCLYCVNMDGELLWKLPVELLLYLTIKDGVVYASGWDCKMHAFTTEGKKLWEFHTSMGYPSEVEFEHLSQVSVEIVHRPSLTKDEKEVTENETRFVNYGEFGGRYVGEEMRDYLGSPIDKNGLSMTYRRVKGVYRK